MQDTQAASRRTILLPARQMETTLRIGDLAATMIYAQYMAMWEGKIVDFPYLEPSHRELHLDRLFPHVIHQFRTQGEADAPVHDPGPLWIVVPELVAAHGGQLLPRPRFESSLYGGPALPKAPFAVFSTLFNPPYNQSRGMSPTLVNQLLQGLAKKLGRQLWVITDTPELIDAPDGVFVVPRSNTYDLLYIINAAMAFIGGDTGFSHFAGLSRVPLIISLYGNNSYGVTSEYGEAWAGRIWNSLPCTDSATTEHHVHLMQNNQLIGLQRFAIEKAVFRILAAR